MQAITGLLRKYWFLIGLVVMISAGISLGMTMPQRAVKSTLGLVQPRLLTAVVLFLMSITLDNRQLIASFRHPGPVLWACLVNYLLMPLMALGLMNIQQLPDFRVGLMLAASVPCTMAAASVWTRKGNGNDAVSLLVTVVTNGFCFLLSPLWLGFVIGKNEQVGLEQREMMVRLVSAVLIPLILGQGLRLIPRVAAAATRGKTPLGVVAQSLILTLVLSSACQAGQRIAAGGPRPDLSATAIVWITCIVLHLAAMGIAVAGSRLFRFESADEVAVAFAGSQKTLPIGVLLADMIAAGAPFAVFPMLMFHASQLFTDTIIAVRFAARRVEQPETSAD